MCEKKSNYITEERTEMDERNEEILKNFEFFQVDTIKRMCIRRLPPMLAIQLKRFDYDWER